MFQASWVRSRNERPAQDRPELPRHQGKSLAQIEALPVWGWEAGPVCAFEVEIAVALADLRRTPCVVVHGRLEQTRSPPPAPGRLCWVNVTAVNQSYCSERDTDH